MRTAVFSCLGLGDGLISLVLSQNMAKQGWQVDTFHPSLQSLQSWFPHLPLLRLPPKEELENTLRHYDRFFLFYEKSESMLRILELCQNKWPNRLTVLNPIATLRHDYPYWEGGKFEGCYPFVQNLVNFCRHTLGFASPTFSNGITPPPNTQVQRYPKRIVLHPKSSRETKNWPWEKFQELATRLEQKGFDPWFILSASEKEEAPACKSPDLSTLSEMAHFVAESGAMIGNDSGIGHLASCFGLPTVTICRHRQASLFWRPGWSPGVVLTPPSLMPNLKGMRWRDRYWKECISVKRVENAFLELYKKTVEDRLVTAS